MKQKDAVVASVERILGTRFLKYQTNALNELSNPELEQVKVEVTQAIIAGTVDYSKDRTNLSEVRTYARSMVMNHLKKSQALYGYEPNRKSSPIEAKSKLILDSVVVVNKTIKNKNLKGISLESLSEELKEFTLNRLA